MRRIIYLLAVVLVALMLFNHSSSSPRKTNPISKAGKGHTQPKPVSVVKAVGGNQVSPPVANPIAWVVVAENCRTCKTGPVVDQLRALFPGLQVQYVGSQEAPAQEIIKTFHINILPAYVFSKSIENMPAFAQFAQLTTFYNDLYYVNPTYAGASYFLGRVPEPHRLDAFIFLNHPQTPSVINIFKEIRARKMDVKLEIHLVGVKDAKTQEPISPQGRMELAEDKLFACVEKYYPQKSWDYLSCRLQTPTGVWLEDCLKSGGINKNQIKSCIEGNESSELVKEKFQLAEKLQIFYAPLVLMDNVEIFGVGAGTTADELLSVVDPNEKLNVQKKENQ